MVGGEPSVRDLSRGIPLKIGRYDVLAYLAVGGMAELFLGADAGRPVVIKRILPHLARQTQFVSMFIDEARFGSAIRHPNLVEVYELGQIGSDLFLVMEYLAGENLAGVIRRLVAREQRLGYALCAHVIAEAAAGLHAAHEQCDDAGKPLRVVHRDVSPQNILVTYAGDTKVLDFGIATAAQRLSHTATGQLKGKSSYMSPEQCRGDALDAGSDIFSLGVVLYELAMLKRLFKRPTELMVLKAVCDDPIPRPSRERPDFPRALEAVIMRALERDRAKRFATAGDMAAALAAAMREMDAPANPRALVAAELERLFGERIADKARMLSYIQLGRELGSLPTAEVDEAVDVPQVSAPPPPRLSAPSVSETGGGMPVIARAPARGGRAVLIGGTAAVVLGAAAALGWHYLGGSAAPPARAAPPVVAQPVAPPARAVDAPAVVAVPAEVVIDIDTMPHGATVLLDGQETGKTPVELRLPRGTAPMKLEIRRAGYAPIAQDVAPDRDQRFVLSLVRAHTESAAPPRHAVTPPPVDPPKPPAAGSGSDSGFHRFD